MLSELTAHSAFSHLQITQNAFILICFEIYILDLFFFFYKIQQINFENITTKKE